MQLVTGGLGFIGNELVRQLSRTEDVVILDNKNRIAPRIDDLAKIQVCEVDLTCHERVREAIHDLKPQKVFHLAAIHYIPECNANPEKTLRVNVEATLGLLEACVKAKVEHFLFASSGAVYADSPQSLNEHSTIAPVDIYGWSKWFAEELCGWYSRQSTLPVTICRFFNTYGPRETNAHIIPEIIQQLRQGDVLRLGNITPRRDFIHVRDVAQAARRLAELGPTGHPVVNVASGYHASVEELVELMRQLLGRPISVEIDRSRFRAADKQIQVADTSRLKSLTGWQPEINLLTGLEDLFRFEGLLGPK
jgi:UDP-glucose 4-epimerase